MLAIILIAFYLVTDSGSSDENLSQKQAYSQKLLAFTNAVREWPVAEEDRNLAAKLIMRSETYRRNNEEHRQTSRQLALSFAVMFTLFSVLLLTLSKCKKTCLEN